MKNVNKILIRQAQRMTKLQARLMQQQQTRAQKLLKSAYFRKEVKKFRKKFISLGFPSVGFPDIPPMKNWLAALSTDSKSNFSQALEEAVTLILISCDYSDEWREPINNFIYFNVLNPPRYNCKIEKGLNETNHLWGFKVIISGHNTVPSATELTMLRLELEDYLSWRRKQYFKTKELAEKEIAHMLEHKKRYKITRENPDRSPLSYKEISSKLFQKYNIKISVAALKKIKSRQNIKKGDKKLRKKRFSSR